MPRPMPARVSGCPRVAQTRQQQVAAPTAEQGWRRGEEGWNVTGRAQGCCVATRLRGGASLGRLPGQVRVADIQKGGKHVQLFA